MITITITGQWRWRDNEISLKHFYQMELAERLKHVDYLQTLSIEELSTNDFYILSLYRRAPENKPEDFLKL